MSQTSSLEHLIALYGDEIGRATYDRLRTIIETYRPRLSPPKDTSLSERDSILITYGDQVQEAGRPPLQTLADFCTDHLRNVVSGVHILPFYPWTSDDGFSVKDYRAIDPALGAWEDLSKLGRNFRLMFDGVINHISSQSDWFQKFLAGNPEYLNYFIVVEGNPDLSSVVRPRALPLLTTFDTPSGSKQVWTTFSEDQIDLNVKHPAVLLEIIDTLLLYVQHGAQFIRLDAIAYLWKEIGTASIHLPQTHRVIQLFRAVLDEVAPYVRLITETNVPHADNISYFGDGTNEAQLVYNFALPPLTLHTLRTANSEALSQWAAGLTLPSEQTTFFNFLASHDGIGLNPVRGILPQADIDALAQQVLDHTGLISYKYNPDGSQSPYELNINYFDALSNPKGDEPLDVQVDRFMAAQAIMLMLVGVPGIYAHSLFGSRGWLEGVKQTSRNRTINRQKFRRTEIEAELINSESLRHKVFGRYRALLQARAASPAFDPHGGQQVIQMGSTIFALLRTSPDARHRVLCLQNVSKHSQTMNLDWEQLTGSVTKNVSDLVTDRPFNIRERFETVLSPYQTLWLTT